MVIFALPAREFPQEFFINWIRFMTFLKNQKIDFMISSENSSNVSVVREFCLGMKGVDFTICKNQEPFYGKIDYDYIMWIDSDSIFKPEDFMKLLSHKVDIVGGLVKKSPKLYSCTMLNESVPFEELQCMTDADVEGKTELIEGIATGMAFTLVKRGVFEKIPRPWFATTSISDPIAPGRMTYVGEDVYFCFKAREAGFKIWLDPTVKVAHLKSYPML
jgi:hypothetical protein